MSLADFAFPSNCSRGIRRPKSQARQRCNDLIHRIRDTKVRNSQFFTSSDDVKKSEIRDDLFRLTDISCSPDDKQAFINPLLRSRRPWTAPVRPLLKTLHLKRFQLSQNRTIDSNNGNIENDHLEVGLSEDIKSSISTTVELPEVNITKWKPRPRKERKHKSHPIVPSRIKKSVSKQKTGIVQSTGKEQNKELLQAKRKERTKLAEKRRNDLCSARKSMVQDTLVKKEQRRLRNIKRKEIEIQQIKLLTAVVVASATQRWLHDATATLADFRRIKLLEEAAIKIQTMWKKEMFVRKALIAWNITKKLKYCGWRIKLHARCNRRKLYAKVIKTFLVDMANHPLSFALYKFRWRVLNAQRLTRKFLDCRRARLQALEEQWRRLENKVIVTEESKRKRKRRKNALSDITHRKILSKGLAGLVKGVVDNAELPNSALHVTPHETYRLLCQFHLEDCRRILKEQPPTPKKAPANDRLYDLTNDDARKLLEGVDIEKSVKYHITRSHPCLMLYSRKNELRIKIEDFRQHEEAKREAIEERLKLYKESYEANRYAACGSPILVKKMPSQMVNATDMDVAIELNVPSYCIEEMRQLFNLLDRDSSGFLTREKIKCLFDICGYAGGNLTTEFMSKMGPTIQFPGFVRILHLELNRELPYSCDLVMHAFDFFVQTDCERVEGVIPRQLLMEILQLHGDEKWTVENSASCLNSVGLVSTQIYYRNLVEDVHRLWECKTIHNFLRTTD